MSKDNFDLVQRAFRELRIRPKKFFGQNFLIDENVSKKIIEAVFGSPTKIRSGQFVLEIGSGLGFLTKILAEKADRVIAVEKDKALALYLKREMVKYKNVKIINEDILKLEIRNPKAETINSKQISDPKYQIAKQVGNRELKIENYIIVANLPYYITSPVIRKFLENPNPPKEMYLMVQKEVAERICEKDKKSSLLSIMVNFYSNPEILFFVPKTAFWPEPKVDSAFIKLKIKSQKLKVNIREFFRLARIGFSSKRKKLSNNLASGFHILKTEADAIIKEAGYDPNVRAENLKIKDWLRLFEAIKQKIINSEL